MSSEVEEESMNMLGETQPNNSSKNQEPTAKGKITPELVQQVAERVYKMLRNDLQLERERARTGSNVQIGGFRG